MNWKLYKLLTLRLQTYTFFISLIFTFILLRTLSLSFSVRSYTALKFSMYAKFTSLWTFLTSYSLAFLLKYIPILFWHFYVLLAVEMIELGSITRMELASYLPPTLQYCKLNVCFHFHFIRHFRLSDFSTSYFQFVWRQSGKTWERYFCIYLILVRLSLWMGKLWTMYYISLESREFCSNMKSFLFFHWAVGLPLSSVLTHSSRYRVIL